MRNRVHIRIDTLVLGDPVRDADLERVLADSLTARGVPSPLVDIVAQRVLAEARTAAGR